MLFKMRWVMKKTECRNKVYIEGKNSNKIHQSIEYNEKNNILKFQKQRQHSLPQPFLLFSENAAFLLLVRTVLMQQTFFFLVESISLIHGPNRFFFVRSPFSYIFYFWEFLLVPPCFSHVMLVFNFVFPLLK
jgi:hypothetical protein